MAAMARVRLFHWKAQESAAFTEPLRAAGHHVAYDEKIAPGLFSRIRQSPAAQTKLWVIWPKGGQQAGITQQFIRESALAVGLVDYKICAVNDRWSAIAFAKKKA